MNRVFLKQFGGLLKPACWVMSCNGMAFFPGNFVLQTPHDHDEDHHQPPTPVNQMQPSRTPQDFHGVASFLGKRSMSFPGIDVCEEANREDDLSDDGSQTGEKKKRLNMEQVKTLEKNFELGNRLEPARKMQLARALGLQPKQIAIWFQNRRARWKTKQLEKDYDLLKRQYEVIKAENDTLQAQNQKLHAEILALKAENQLNLSTSIKKLKVPAITEVKTAQMSSWISQEHQQLTARYLLIQKAQPSFQHL